MAEIAAALHSLETICSNSIFVMRSQSSGVRTITSELPMTELDLARVESILGFAMPKHYRQFILQHSEELRNIERALPLRTVVFTDPDELIFHNQFAQGDESLRIGDAQRLSPERNVLVATNGAGDCWYVSRDQADRGVWHWSHETCEMKQVNESLEEYIDELRAEMRTPEKWQHSAHRSDRKHLRRLAIQQRRAMVALIVFLGSIPAFAGFCYFLDHVLGFPISQYPYQFLGGFVALQVLLYYIMATIVYQLGCEMRCSWVIAACIATVILPAVALVALLILSQQASKELVNAGVKVGFLGANPKSI